MSINYFDMFVAFCVNSLELLNKLMFIFFYKIGHTKVLNKVNLWNKLHQKQSCMFLIFNLFLPLRFFSNGNSP